MKTFQNEITGTQIRFFTNFGGELSFILSFKYVAAVEELRKMYFHLLLPT
jgi:hypothetical protein